jgi:surface protein
MTFSIRTAAIAAVLAAAPTLAAANTFVVPLGEDVATDGMTDDIACETTPIGETCEATIDGRSETLLVVDNGSIRTAANGGIEVDGVTYAPGLPNGLYTGKVTDMTGLFFKRYDFDKDIGHWDTSQVTTMRLMFGSSWSGDVMTFNQDISDWDTSNVTDMSRMFYSNPAFNQPIGSWDVSSVETMRGMFNASASAKSIGHSFNQPLNDWDVSNVRDMGHMFYRARSFNQDLDRWDTSNVENMRRTFRSAYSFNGDISTWDVSSVTDMGEMFAHGVPFNGDLSEWDVSNVTNMYAMFRYGGNGTGLSNWCVTEIGERPDKFGIRIENSPVWGACPE